MGDISCGACGSRRTYALADAVGCEACGAATRYDGTLAHGPTGRVFDGPPTEAPAAANMTTTATVAESKADLSGLTAAQLREAAAEQNIPGRSTMTKAELIEALGG